MNTELVVQAQANALSEVLETTLNGVGQGSRPVYRGAIEEYLTWVQSQDNKTAYSSMLAYRQTLEERGLAAGTINRILSALRGFFRTAYNMQVIDDATYRQTQEVKNIHTQGQKRGKWLTLKTAKQLLSAPDADTWIGKRDRAILALMLGAGLRRSEVTNLRLSHLIYADDVLIITDLLGKHNRIRSIPLQAWVTGILFDYINNTVDKMADKNSLLFVSRDRHGNFGESLSTQAIWQMVKQYAAACGFDRLAPHDLRRTYAELAREGGAELEEVQVLLGHSSLAVTQRYLSRELDGARVSQFIQMDV